jgi:hypothetical protein
VRNDLEERDESEIVLAFLHELAHVAAALTDEELLFGAAPARSEVAAWLQAGAWMALSTFYGPGVEEVIAGALVEAREDLTLWATHNAGAPQGEDGDSELAREANQEGGDNLDTSPGEP